MGGRMGGKVGGRMYLQGLFLQAVLLEFFLQGPHVGTDLVQGFFA